MFLYFEEKNIVFMTNEIKKKKMKKKIFFKILKISRKSK